MARYIFLRTAWMEHYQGVTNDTPVGAGKYVAINKDGGEVWNFKPLRNNMYGYAEISKGRGLRIERIGANKEDEYIDDITTVFFARNPETGGEFIVGWYKNARLYRERQYIGDRIYITKAPVKDATLLPPEKRIFKVSGAGQTNAWYVEDYTDKKYLNEVITYIGNPESYIEKKKRKTANSSPWQPDIEKRKKVELSAMDKVAEYYLIRDYEIKDCHKENCGWDMEATRGSQTLLLEVKGLSGPYNVVELTANEYMMALKHKKHYRLCIVPDALNKNSQPDIYYFEKGRWINNNGNSCAIKTHTAAKFYKQ